MPLIVSRALENSRSQSLSYARFPLLLSPGCRCRIVPSILACPVLVSPVCRSCITARRFFRPLFPATAHSARNRVDRVPAHAVSTSCDHLSRNASRSSRVWETRFRRALFIFNVLAGKYLALRWEYRKSWLRGVY